MKEKIAIIGNGNMGQAIIKSLLDKKIVTKDQLIVTDSKTSNNKEAVQKADIIILAVKPQIMKVVLEEIQEVLKEQLIISIAAGITIKTIQKTLGKKIAVVRVMPNLGATVGKSMSVWVRGKEVTGEHRKIVKTILEAIGIQVELHKQEQIDAATAISGSGPAYFFYLTELLEKEALELGFPKEVAIMLAKQTFIGSVEILKSSHKSVEDLRNAVTSKGGTTEAAIKQLEKDKFKRVFHSGVIAAYNKAKELNL